MSRLQRQLKAVPPLLAGGVLGLSILVLCWKAAAINQPGITEPSVAVSHQSDSSLLETNSSAPADTDVLAETSTSTPGRVEAPTTSPEETVSTNAVVVPEHAGILNDARQFALGMIETGNMDGAIGGLGEVSRFQIMPSVWKRYSASRSYQNVAVSTEVARQHWLSLYEYFKNKTDREPSDFDMYVLWNTRYGYYAGKDFSPGRLSPVVRDRAQRFANLVEDHVRSEHLLALASTSP